MRILCSVIRARQSFAPYYPARAPHAPPLHMPGGAGRTMGGRRESANRSDAWRREARNSGYRTRSAFKLKQIQEKFGVIRRGDTVLDVGCHPGGWSQVAVESAGGDGVVIGVDLKGCAPVDGCTFVVGDITEEGTQQRIRDTLDGEVLRVVVSDISPSLTGQYEMDQAISIELVCAVFDFVFPLMDSGGVLVTKVFQGRGIEALISAANTRFSKVQRFSPDASRNSSSETYLICRNRKVKPSKGTGGKSVQELVDETLTEDGFVLPADEVDERQEAGRVGFRLVRSTSDEGE